MRTRTVLVTGGAGFIGANLVRRLCRDGVQVVALDDLSTGLRSNLGDCPARFVRASVLDEDVLAELMPAADAVVHLAALPSVPRSILNPRATHDVNATGTLCVLEAARRQGTHVILASSSSVYGRNPGLPKTEDMQAMPMSPYAVSKLAAEQYALAYGVCYGLPVLAFRFFNVFGPLQRSDHVYAAAIPIFMSRALRGQQLLVQGDGNQSRDFTYVGTVLDVVSAAVHRRVTSPDPVNLAYGGRITLNDLIQQIGEVLQLDVDVVYGPERTGDVRHSQADSRRLRGLFPELTPVPIRTGLVETAAWMRSDAVSPAAIPVSSMRSSV